jgi:hypothetical protein
MRAAESCKPRRAPRDAMHCLSLPGLTRQSIHLRNDGSPGPAFGPPGDDGSGAPPATRLRLIFKDALLQPLLQPPHSHFRHLKYKNGKIAAITISSSANG